MANAARKLRQALEQQRPVDPARVRELMSALLELGAAKDGVWDDVSVAALRRVADEMARRVARIEDVRSRLRGLEALADARSCVGAVVPSDPEEVPPALGVLLRGTELTAGQRRYIATLYASDPVLRAAIDDVVGSG